MTHLPRFAAVTLAFALLAAACGSDGSTETINLGDEGLAGYRFLFLRHQACIPGRQRVEERV